MGQFEREVNRALEIFVATVNGVAERLTIEALRSAFVRGSHHTTSGHAATSLRKYRAYFAVEHVNGERAEPSVTLAEATA